MREFWESLGAGKYGVLGAFLRVIIAPPATRREAVQIVVTGFLSSLAFIALAEAFAPHAVTAAAWIGALIGATVFAKLITWVQTASLSEIIAAWRGRPPRPPNNEE